MLFILNSRRQRILRNLLTKDVWKDSCRKLHANDDMREVDLIIALFVRLPGGHSDHKIPPHSLSLQEFAFSHLTLWFAFNNELFSELILILRPKILCKVNMISIWFFGCISYFWIDLPTTLYERSCQSGKTSWFPLKYIKTT